MALATRTRPTVASEDLAEAAAEVGTPIGLGYIAFELVPIPE
jgi:hypothetical protein